MSWLPIHLWALGHRLVAWLDDTAQDGWMVDGFDVGCTKKPLLHPRYTATATLLSATYVLLLPVLYQTTNHPD